MSQYRAGFALPPGQLPPLDIDESAIGLSNIASLSIGKKWVMAVTGLMWSGFLVMHLIGNLLLFADGHAPYNDYSEHLTDLGPYLWIAEIILAATLLIHLALGVMVWLENKAARPIRYAVDRKKGGRTIMSSTMIWTGIVTIVFVILHLVSIKYGELGMRDDKVDFHGAVMTLLASPGYAIWYILATWLLGVHVSHALQSSLRTLGLNNKRIEPKLKAMSIGFGLLVAIGYSSIPIWIWLTSGGA
jgi:succinate dehydrogenase / fumarate reductase cytochrome b subunit